MMIRISTEQRAMARRLKGRRLWWSRAGVSVGQVVVLLWEEERSEVVRRDKGGVPREGVQLAVCFACCGLKGPGRKRQLLAVCRDAEQHRNTACKCREGGCVRTRRVVCVWEREEQVQVGRAMLGGRSRIGSLAGRRTAGPVTRPTNSLQAILCHEPADYSRSGETAIDPKSLEYTHLWENRSIELTIQTGPTRGSAGRGAGGLLL